MSMYYPLIFNFSWLKIENIILLTLDVLILCTWKKVNEDEEREDEWEEGERERKRNRWTCTITGKKIKANYEQVWSWIAFHLG